MADGLQSRVRQLPSRMNGADLAMGGQSCARRAVIHAFNRDNEVPWSPQVNPRGTTTTTTTERIEDAATAAAFIPFVRGDKSSRGGKLVLCRVVAPLSWRDRMSVRRSCSDFRRIFHGVTPLGRRFPKPSNTTLCHNSRAPRWPVALQSREPLAKFLGLAAWRSPQFSWCAPICPGSSTGCRLWRPAARREVEVELFRRVADRAPGHRWVTDARRAPRGRYRRCAGYVTRRTSWSAVSASTANMQWHITFAAPRTRTWRPPNSSLRRPLTRSGPPTDRGLGTADTPNEQPATAILGVEGVGYADGDILTRHPATGHHRPAGSSVSGRSNDPSSQRRTSSPSSNQRSASIGARTDHLKC